MPKSRPNPTPDPTSNPQHHQEETPTQWTLAEESMLITGFHAGLKADAMAQALRKTPAAVRWRLIKAGLITHPSFGAPDGEAAESEALGHRHGDLAFKRAMLKAIKSGAEHAVVGTMKCRDPGAVRYVRRLMPEPRDVYQSSAGFTADEGHEQTARRGL